MPCASIHCPWPCTRRSYDLRHKTSLGGHLLCQNNFQVSTLQPVMKHNGKLGLGYRIGRNFRPGGRGSYIGTRPSKKSVQSICRRISEQTAARHGLLSIEEMVTRLNWLSTGWANYFRLGQVNPAYAGIDAHMKKRIRQWLCRKHKVQSGGWARFPHEELYKKYGLICLEPTTKGLPWAKT